MNRIRIDDIPLEDGDDEFLSGVFQDPDGPAKARERERTRRKRQRRRKKSSDDESTGDDSAKSTD